MPSSGQGGPCCHCGRTHSCCWRRGPPSKPILCNACGSRYLVKRSLEGYQPLQTRREQAGAAKQHEAAGKEGAGKRAAPHAAAGRVAKPKRAAPKRNAHADEWHSDVSDSEASGHTYLTDDSAGSSRRASARLAAAPAAAAGAAQAAAQQQPQQHAAPAAGRKQQQQQQAKEPGCGAHGGELKLSYITSQSQLRDLGMHADISSIANAFFASSMRLKPRKPMVVTVSAVW